MFFFSFYEKVYFTGAMAWHPGPPIRPPGWASPSSRPTRRLEGKGVRGGRRDPHLPPAARPLLYLPGPRDQRSPVPARARSAPGAARGHVWPGRGLPEPAAPSSAVSSEEPASRFPPGSRQEAVVLSSDRDGSEAALRVIPGVKYSGLASSFLSSNPVAREQETPPRKPQDSPHLAN